MSVHSMVLARLGTGLAWLAAVSFAASIAAQEAPLGKPAGWAVEDTAALIDVIAGSQLQLEPEDDSQVLTLLPEARLPLLESRGSWVQVRYGDRIGWIDLDAPPATMPLPVLVVPEAEPEVLRPKLEMLSFGPLWTENDLGPYKLFSRVQEPALIDYLARVAAEHAQVYAERYGLASAELADGEVDGTVVLCASRHGFLEFQRSRGHNPLETRIEGYFHSPDIVVTYRGKSSRQQLAATHIHELTHLLNWRILSRWGRADLPMPPWLEEGMAEDMSLSRIDRKGRLVAEPLGPTNLRYDRRLGVLLLEVEQKISFGGTAPSVPQLLAMDREAFMGSDSELNYLMSALVVRYLLDDAELSIGFREFLAAVADGGSPDSEEMRLFLNTSWERLSQGFRGWLLIQQARVGT